MKTTRLIPKIQALRASTSTNSSSLVTSSSVQTAMSGKPTDLSGVVESSNDDDNDNEDESSFSTSSEQRAVSCSKPRRRTKPRTGRDLSSELQMQSKRTFRHRADYGSGTAGFPLLTSMQESIELYSLWNPRPTPLELPRQISRNDSATHPPRFYPLSDHEVVSVVQAGFSQAWLCQHFPADFGLNGLRKTRKAAGWPAVTELEGTLVFCQIGGMLMCGDYAHRKEIQVEFDKRIKLAGFGPIEIVGPQVVIASDVQVPEHPMPQSALELAANANGMSSSQGLQSSRQEQQSSTDSAYVTPRPFHSASASRLKTPLPLNRTMPTPRTHGQTRLSTNAMQMFGNSVDLIASAEERSTAESAKDQRIAELERALAAKEDEVAQLKEALATAGQRIGQDAGDKVRILKSLGIHEEMLRWLGEHDNMPPLDKMFKVSSLLRDFAEPQRIEGPDELMDPIMTALSVNFSAKSAVEKATGRVLYMPDDTAPLRDFFGIESSGDLETSNSAFQQAGTGPSSRNTRKSRHSKRHRARKSSRSTRATTPHHESSSE